MDKASLQDRTLAIVMGGGAGTRLFPLTKDRAKPAVPLAGKYRLVDIPIINCVKERGSTERHLGDRKWLMLIDRMLRIECRVLSKSAF